MMTFNIIKRKKNPLGLITNSQWLIVLLFVAVFGILYFLKNSKFLDLLMLFFFFGIIGIIIFRFMDYEKLNANIIGKLIVDKEYFLIDNIKIHISEIGYLHMKIKHFTNEEQELYLYKFNPQYFMGKGNYFKIITKSNKEYEGEFLIQSRMEFLKLENYYKDLSKISK
ncbi:hypothetical protein QGN23_10865 [Chryseobacterium gotjawalense]|uniref:Uncharacterized protein n=1 Tax=Chryseobacterium gotjawalense TaxID=3042315 RepID=A0ABY8RAF3_9FLAO|nr:hypothetical protein [Chryseobacterium sp. wdc7]WHF50927.1 hypothetical protein QGN23_10865 [Chryseobacterium sp. wdc7]